MFKLFDKSPPWDSPTFWALDLETSGLRPKDQILSLGMVPITGGRIAWGQHHYTLVQPTQPQILSTQGIQAHHILPSELSSAPTLQHALADFTVRLGSGVLLLHHASIDLPFLQRAYRTHGMTWPQPKVVDTARLTQRLNQRLQQLQPHANPLPGQLGGLRAALGLPEHLEHHALYDALATAELFLLLRHRLQARTLSQLT